MGLFEYGKKNINIIYRNLFAVLIFGMVFSLGHAYFGITTVKPVLYPAVVLCMLFVFLFSMVRGKGKIVIALSLILFFTAYFLYVGRDVFAEIVRSYFQWAMYSKYHEKYLVLFEIIQIFWMSCFSFAVAFLWEKSRKIKAIVFLCLCGFVVYMILNEISVSKTGAAFLFLFLFANLTEFAEGKWKKERIHTNPRIYLLWLWPVWLLFFGTICVAPVSMKPYPWTFVERLYSNISESVEGLFHRITSFGREDFDVRMCGFSNDSSFGGNLFSNSENVLKLTSNGAIYTNLYLKGLDMDTFTGREWKKSFENERNEMLLDTIETLNAVWNYDAERTYDFLSGSWMNLEYRYLRSKYFFLNTKTQQFQMENKKMFTDTQAESLWNKSKGMQDEYQTYFFQMNLGYEELDTLIEQAKSRETEQGFAFTSQKYCGGAVTYDNLLTCRDKIRQYYLKPVVIGENMERWVQSVTEDCDTKLNCLRAVEAALRSLKYTKFPGELPEGVENEQDFLEYFVLQKQEGYCTYFATAFTILARYLDCPARFVQGYCVPMRMQREMDVTENMAHAWSEVYFEGFGWIPFEPTAGYENSLYTPWQAKKVTESETGRPDFDFEEWWEKYSKMDEVSEEIPEAKENEQESDGSFLSRFVFIAAGIPVLLLLSLGFDVCVGKSRYRKKSLNERYQWEIKRMFEILKKMGLVRQPEETLEEFQARLSDFMEQKEEHCPSFIAFLERYLYAGEQADTQEIELVRRERRMLLCHLGRWTVLKESYLFARTSIS